MKIIRTASFQKVAFKFVNEGSLICEFCIKPLQITAIVPNTHHIYTLGQMYECPCDRSKLWTNSIRDEETILNFFHGKPNIGGLRYTQGFCNDKFCGHCMTEQLLPYKNGATAGPYRGDRYQCPKCFPYTRETLYSIKGILVLGDKLWPEGQSYGDQSGNVQLLNWYKQRQGEIERLITELKSDAHPEQTSGEAETEPTDKHLSIRPQPRSDTSL